MIVLYAEDDIEDLDTFCEVLASINPSIKCINARDGQEALEILENAVVLPDYIFLDINMPTMDGKSCLKNIRKDERFKTIPVVIYTTSSNKKDIDLCMQLGAAEYIQKPNSMKEAIDKLSKYF
jgi:CheY-like chemotaxis protein